MFEATNSRFAFSPGQLNKLLNPKSLSAIYRLGGLRGLAKGLVTDRMTGLTYDEAYPAMSLLGSETGIAGETLEHRVRQKAYAWVCEKL